MQICCQPRISRSIALQSETANVLMNLLATKQRSRSGLTLKDFSTKFSSIINANSKENKGDRRFLDWMLGSDRALPNLYRISCLTSSGLSLVYVSQAIAKLGGLRSHWINTSHSDKVGSGYKFFGIAKAIAFPL